MLITLLFWFATSRSEPQWEEYNEPGQLSFAEQPYDEHVLRTIVGRCNYPMSERQQILAELDTLAAHVDAGRLTGDVLRHLDKDIQMALYEAAIVHLVDTKYVTPAAIDDAEKAAIHQSVVRYAAGFRAGVHTTKSMRAFEEPLRDPDTFELRESITVKQLRACHAAMDQAARKAKTPLDARKRDPSDEVKLLVEAALR